MLCGLAASYVVVSQLCCAVSQLCCAVSQLCCAFSQLCCAVSQLCCAVSQGCNVMSMSSPAGRSSKLVVARALQPLSAFLAQALKEMSL